MTVRLLPGFFDCLKCAEHRWKQFEPCPKRSGEPARGGGLARLHHIHPVSAMETFPAATHLLAFLGTDRLLQFLNLANDQLTDPLAELGGLLHLREVMLNMNQFSAISKVSMLIDDCIVI